MDDMTKGNPFQLLVSFTIPLLLGNLFQQLYSLVDAVIIGRSLGVNALGAISAVGGLTGFVQGFLLGIASGFSFILAQRFGAKNEDRTRSSFYTSIQLSVLGVLIFMIVSIAFSEVWLAMMNIPDNLYVYSRQYFLSAMSGLGIMMYFNIMCNVLRSQGDTKRLLVFTVLSQMLNIVFDVLYVMVFGWGVIGVALATFTSQLFVAFLCHRTILKRIPSFKMSVRDWKIDKREVRLHLQIGLPIGIQSTIISIGSIVLQSQLNTLGSSAVEGHAIGARLEGLFAMPFGSFGVALATFAAQNFGAGKTERIWQGVRSILAVSIGYSAFISVLLFFKGTDLAAFFFGEGSPEMVGYLQTFLTFEAAFYWVLAILFVIRSCLQGMGKSVAPTIAGFMEMAMRTIVPLSFTGLIGFPAIAMSHPLAWIGSTTVLLVAFVLVRKNDTSKRWKRFLAS